MENDRGLFVLLFASLTPFFFLVVLFLPLGFAFGQ